MQAILIKYKTNGKGGARWAVSCGADRKTYGYDHETSYVCGANDAGMKLVAELGWGDYGTWTLGTLPNGDFALVCCERSK